MTQNLGSAPVQTSTVVEEFTIQGTQLTSTIGKLLHEGNVRRITVKRNGELVADIPFAVGLLSFGLAPAVVIPGAFGLLLTGFTIQVLRVNEQPTTYTVE
ncbi:MAG: DUF4342 domain-containing protein [Chloroflexi bacterium]|nr:DUF4342 domain-containing protein [Chloroflexota bacterium]